MLPRLDFDNMTYAEGLAVISQYAPTPYEKKAEERKQVRQLVDAFFEKRALTLKEFLASPITQGTALGAGIGGIGGVLSSQLQKKKRRRPVARGITGALLGGLVGGGVGAIGASGGFSGDTEAAKPTAKEIDQLGLKDEEASAKENMIWPPIRAHRWLRKNVPWSKHFLPSYPGLGVMAAGAGLGAAAPPFGTADAFDAMLSGSGPGGGSETSKPGSPSSSAPDSKSKWTATRNVATDKPKHTPRIVHHANLMGEQLGRLSRGPRRPFDAGSKLPGKAQTLTTNQFRSYAHGLRPKHTLMGRARGGFIGGMIPWVTELAWRELVDKPFLSSENINVLNKMRDKVDVHARALYGKSMERARATGADPISMRDAYEYVQQN